jgi:hypothetical protein
MGHNVIGKVAPNGQLGQGPRSSRDGASGRAVDVVPFSADVLEREPRLFRSNS